MAQEIINRVAGSGLLTIDLAEWIDEVPHAELDIAPWLFQGLILREKDFRASVSAHDWMQYTGKHVSVYCSTEAIIPFWAFMLLGGELNNVGAIPFYGTAAETFPTRCREIIREALPQHVPEGARLIIKGCNKYDIAPDTYLFLAAHAKPRIKNLMYGEACSTVPIYKNKPAPAGN